MTAGQPVGGAALELIQGHCYRAKKPRATGGLFSPVYNDRQIVHVGIETIQYDSPTVKNGSHYPKVTKEKFLAWAGSDVTDQMPKGDWAPWPRT